MKSIKESSFLAIKLIITFLLLINSIKFFTYFFDPYSFSFASFVDENGSLNNAIYKKIVLEYSKILYNQEVVYFSFFVFFFLGSIFYLVKTKQSIFNYFLITIVLLLIQKVDLIKFNNPHFLALIPKNICGGIRNYLLINGLAFLLIGTIFFLVSFRIFPFSVLSSSNNNKIKNRRN
ncbi:MAG: hypothetical protein KGM16_13820 [Bacteroidota bacterium]|nr:hypothetical protein [Bacteroidota bacterium]